jgi:glycosyltransferase involved in cell wall biosynthesis
MKIATNISLSPIGGIARRVREMKRKVNQGDGTHRLVIIEIHPKKRLITEDRHTKIYKVPLPDTITLETIYQGVQSLDDLQQRFEPTIQEIEDILGKENIDVVLSEGTYYAPWCLYQAAKKVSSPLVILYAGILKYETRHFPEKLRKILIGMENSFIDPRLMYLFPSNLTRNAVQMEYGQLERTKVVPNGVSKEFFQLEPKYHFGGIGFVGRATKTKNPEYLIMLRDEMRRQKLDMDIYMVSHFSDMNWLKKRLTKAGIKMLSFMDTQRLRDFYRERGIIISPSLFETYGNVPIESIAAGTPALINKNMGVAEIFKKHNLESFIVDFNNVQDTVSSIDTFRDYRIEKDIRESLRRYVWDAVIEEYFQVCRLEIEKHP